MFFRGEGSYTLTCEPAAYIGLKSDTDGAAGVNVVMAPSCVLSGVNVVAAPS
jgi:hypothetical protein